MQNVGASWLMTDLAASPFAVALVQAATNLPFCVLAVPAGALADIVDRRRLLLVAQSWMLLVPEARDRGHLRAGHRRSGHHVAAK